MQLRELQEGQRFEFVDKRTPLALVTGERFPPVGSFRYVAPGESACPVLVHVISGRRIVAVPGSYLLEVLLIL